MHMRVWRWARRRGRQLPPHSAACAQLAEPHVCAAAQFGGAMVVLGFESSASAFMMTISDVTITGCSAEAGREEAVRARHVAQRGPSVGGAGVTGVPRVACGVDVRTRLANL